MSCKSHPTFLGAVVAALVFTAVINTPTALSLFRREPALVSMGTSVDELFYFSQMRSAAEGRWNLGNPALIEHRGDPAAGSVAPVIQGALMRFLHLDLPAAVFLGDIVFPFLAVLFLAMALTSFFQEQDAAARRLYRPAVMGAGTALLAAATVGFGFLRSINPQVALVVICASLWAFLALRPRPAVFLLRGALIGLLLFVHSVMVPFLLAVEGFALLFDPRVTRWRNHASGFILALLPVLLAAAVKFSFSLHADPAVLADTYRRLGMIPSHLSAAPFLQVKIAAVGIVLFFLCRYSSGTRKPATLLLILCGALLLALNQSLVHGIDIVFGLYYERLAQIVLPIAAAFVLLHLLPQRAKALVGPVCAAIGIVFLTLQAVRQTEAIAAEVRSLDPHVTEVLSTLRALPGVRVVLAPPDIADRIPALTPHAVLFSRSAFYENASDRELAERFLLEESFFPTPLAQRDDTYGYVFGISAGNVAARERTLCRLLSFFRKSDAQCRVPICSRIFHQELLPFLDHPSIDPLQLLRAFGVTAIITDQPLPAATSRFCKKGGAAGNFTLWSCAFSG